jgi:hypothetical protein
MTHQLVWHRAAIATALTLFPASSQAQLPATSVDDSTNALHSILQKTEVLFVRQVDSEDEIQGEFLDLTADTLTLQVDGLQTNVPLASVSRIQREGDSLSNGAAIGGGILGVWCALVCGQGLDSANQYLPAVAFNTALGALLGLLIDHGHKGRTTIYPVRPPARSAGAAISGNPMVALRFRF